MTTSNEKPNGRLDNQANAQPVAVIVGGTSGIGSKLAARLTASGYRLALLGRDHAKLSDVAKQTGGHDYTLDVTDFDEMAAAFKEIDKTLGRIKAVANCVGSMLLKPAHRTTPHQYHDVMAANLTSAFATVRSAADTMKDGGSVVLVSSVAARTGLANHEAIAAAKAGVIGLMQSAAATYASRGIRFNAVAPGLVKTPMTVSITESPRALEVSEAMHPLGRVGEPGEIAAAIAWLLGDEAGWITGQVLALDGGMSAISSKPTLKAAAPKPASVN